MRRIVAAAAMAAAFISAAPAAAQFGGSPEEQVDGDGAPIRPGDGFGDGKPYAGQYDDQWGGKPEWAGEVSDGGYWSDPSHADEAGLSGFYEDKPYPAEEYAQPDDAEAWEGADGQNYCRRSDGTTGLVVGAGAGALVGRGFDTRGERGTGTILGAVVGALLGSAVERGASCR